MRIRFYFFMLAACIIAAGCNHEPQKVINLTGTRKTPVMAPFRYHKLIEVSPGQYYDILSWGRGATDTGSFLILHSDSSGKKYTTTTGDLNGKIIDVYNADMDVDGNPEILIQTKGRDTTDYANIYAFEIDNDRAQKLNFPKLSSSQKNGYRGGDDFYIQDGKFLREFPIYSGSGKNAKPTGQKRKLEYGLNNNTITVKQLSKDSTSVTDKTIATEPVKEKISKKVSKTKKSAHHKTLRRKRRSRRHR